MSYSSDSSSMCSASDNTESKTNDSNTLSYDNAAENVESASSDSAMCTDSTTPENIESANGVENSDLSPKDQAENQQNLQEGDQGIKDMANGLNNAAQNFETNWNQAVDKMSGDISDKIEGAGEMVDAIGEATKDFSQGVGEFEGLGESLEGTFGQENDYMEAIGGIGGEVMEGVVEVGAEVGEAFGEIAGTMVEDVGEFVDHLGEGNIGEIVADKIEDIAKDGVSEALDIPAVDVVAELGEGAVEIAGEVIEAGGEIGREIGEGIHDIAENYF